MSTATEMLAKYLQAESAVLGGQSITFNGRTVSRADLAEIRKGRQEWEKKAQAEEGAGTPTIGGKGFAVATFGRRL
ncbi:MAG: hypothetical protein RSD57_13655 [Comamonas sp.]